MCIAILTLPEKRISQAVFDRCFDNNPHGIGFAFVDQFSGEVQIDKGWFGKINAYKRYESIAEKHGKTNPMMIHFRLATVGPVIGENCHPFAVKGGAMIHNGTFWHESGRSVKKSDSRMLAERMHNELHYANLTQNKEHFQKVFGYNRVAFLFKGGKYVIFSEDYEGNRGRFGQWNDGIWYSNGGWKGGYSDYCGEDESIREVAELDDAMWGFNFRGRN